MESWILEDSRNLGEKLRVSTHSMASFSDLILPSQRPHTGQDITPQKTEDTHYSLYNSQNLASDDTPSSRDIPYRLMDSLLSGSSRSELLLFSSISLEYQYRGMDGYSRMEIELMWA